MDTKTFSILKDARHAILWLSNPQLRQASETMLPRTDIVEAIDALLEAQNRCPKCGDLPTYQTPDGTYWDGNAHFWRQQQIEAQKLK
jgi:hypothetical protein